MVEQDGRGIPVLFISSVNSGKYLNTILATLLLLSDVLHGNSDHGDHGDATDFPISEQHFLLQDTTVTCILWQNVSLGKS